MIKCVGCATDNRDTARFCMKCSLRLPGTILQGRYKISGVLGQGGMGAVYLVEDQSLFGTRWALKELRDFLLSPADRPLAIQQFQREAQLLLGLTHPNLPKISHFFAENGRQHLVMEYIDGDTLEALCQKSATFLSEAQVVDWAVQVCDVLEYLHGQSPPVIFRDLKPANIMLARDGKIKLIDFGIARHFQPGKTQDTQMMGTPGYAAPEQYGGSGQSDGRSDIYALGATLHHLLTRRVPGTPPFIYPACRTINSNVSTHIEAVVAKATEYDRAKRYQLVTEVKRDLLQGTVKPPVVVPAGMGIVGPEVLKWSNMGPMRALTVYCSVDKRETTWIEEVDGTLTCTECATSRPKGFFHQRLLAFCNFCMTQSTWIISEAMNRPAPQRLGLVAKDSCPICGAVIDQPGARFCVNCGAGVNYLTTSAPYSCTCTCQGCGQQRVLEFANDLSTLEVFCSQCRSKTPWLVSPKGRVCLWCGQQK